MGTSLTAFETGPSRWVAERRVVAGRGERMIAFSGRGAQTVWKLLEVFASQWRSIENLPDKPGPFIIRATRTTLRDLDI